MNHKVLLSLVVFFSLSLCAIHPDTSSYMTKQLNGTIQFPKGTSPLPEIRVYSSGRIIGTTSHRKSFSVSYNVPEDKYQHHFFMLITEPGNIFPRSKENEPNVIDFLTIDLTKSYKFYRLSLMRENFQRTFMQQNKTGPTKTKRNDAAWHITEIPLIASNGRIPDETIIVCLPAHCIDRLENNHGLALPTIIVKDDPALFSSDIFNECLLTAMDLDTIHGPIDRATKPIFDHKLVLAMNM